MALSWAKAGGTAKTRCLLTAEALHALPDGTMTHGSQVHPLAATIATRSMVAFTLNNAGSSRYGHAAGHLQRDELPGGDRNKALIGSLPGRWPTQSCPTGRRPKGTWLRFMPLERRPLPQSSTPWPCPIKQRWPWGERFRSTCRCRMDRSLEGREHRLHAEPAAMAKAVDQSLLHGVDLQLDRTGAP